MTESLNMLLELTVERVAEHVRQVREPLCRLAAAGKLRLASPTDAEHDSAIVRAYRSTSWRRTTRSRKPTSSALCAKVRSAFRRTATTRWKKWKKWRRSWRVSECGMRLLYRAGGPGSGEPGVRRR